MVSARLRQLRRQLRLTQAAFGQRLGVSRDVIGNIEYGRVAPRPVFLQHVCRVFRVNPAWLLEGEDPLFHCEPARVNDLDEVISLFSDLTPSFRAYALEQLRGLLRLQSQDQGTPLLPLSPESRILH